MSIVLVLYLGRLGYDVIQTSAVVTGTLLGSAALTLGVGLIGHRVRRRVLLLLAAALMMLTGLGFASVVTFELLLLIAIVGTINPSSGDVTVFLPTEQAALSETIEPKRMTRAFAHYNVAGGVAGALGALASASPALVAEKLGIETAAAERSMFLVYSLIAVFVALIYLGLSPQIEAPQHVRAKAPLEKSRRIVFHLSALFSLDAFGGGFVVQSLLALWLSRRFALEPEEIGVIFFASGLLGAASQLVSAHVVERIGRINTMVFTHVPANVFLILAAIMPTPALAITFLLLRASLSAMDVPARQSFVMAVVPSEERAAASSVTNVPRSLASAMAPLLAGALLERSSFGWPLIVAGTLKLIYDALIYVQFRSVERPAA